MFAKTRQLLRGLSVSLKLAWLLLVAGMLLFGVGILAAHWTAAATGAGCLVVGTFVTAIAGSDRSKPGSTDSLFRAAVLTSLVITPTAGLLVMVPIIAFCGLVAGWVVGFEPALLWVCLRMLALCLVVAGVTSIPTYAGSRDRSAVA